jgi:histone acetyltransferase (RNA polymerase elongator complex component)
LQGTKLAFLFKLGEYKPLELEYAIDICVDLFQQFTAKGIKVIKMGVQIDTVDPEAIIAGPYHKAFGELVLSRLLVEDLISQIPKNSQEIEIIISKHSVSKLKGHSNYGLKLLEKRYPDKKIKLRVDTRSEECFIRLNAN